MKKFLHFIVWVLVFVSCSEKKEKPSEGWKELESFHKVMQRVYHPMQDSGNLAPAKKLMNQLADEADRWADAKIPEEIDTPEMKARLQKLKTDARALANEITKGSTDDSLKEKLTHLHSEFHEIMEATFSTKEKEDEGKDEHEDH